MGTNIIKDNPYLFLTTNDFIFDIEYIINNVKNKVDVKNIEELEKKFSSYFNDFVYDSNFDINFKFPLFEILKSLKDFPDNISNNNFNFYLENLENYLNELNKEKEILIFDESKEKRIEYLENEIIELENRISKIKNIENILSSFENIDQKENSKKLNLKEVENRLNNSNLELRLLKNEKINFQLRNDKLKKKKIEYLKDTIKHIKNFNIENLKLKISTEGFLHNYYKKDIESLKKSINNILYQFDTIISYLSETDNYENLKLDNYKSLKRILENENNYLNIYIKKLFYKLRLFLEKLENKNKFTLKESIILNDINKLENSLRVNGIRLKSNFEWDNLYNTLYFQYEREKRKNNKQIKKLNFDYFYEKSLDSHFKSILNYLPHGYIKNGASDKLSNFKKLFLWWATFLKHFDDKIIKKFKSLFINKKETLDEKINFIEKYLKNSNTKDNFLRIAEFLNIEIHIIENHEFISRYNFPYYFPIKLFKENLFERKNKLVISIKNPEVQDNDYKLRKKYLINILTKLTRKNIEVTFVENLKFLY